jgi:hypothetical protein
LQPENHMNHKQQSPKHELGTKQHLPLASWLIRNSCSRAEGRLNATIAVGQCVLVTSKDWRGGQCSGRLAD